MGLFDILKGNAYTTAEKNKLAAIDPSKFISIEQYELLKQQVAELIHLIPQEVDTSVFLTKKDLPTIPSLDGYALKADIPSIAGLATVKQLPSLSGYAKTSDIPKPIDMKLYALKTDIPSIPDTVKYVENSNTKSAIKKISLSIDDKVTFKAESNPVNNIAHTI